jgi:hypothetical protein
VHAIQNKNPVFRGSFNVLQLVYMPCVDCLVYIRRVCLFVCERLGDCLPERLTATLTVLEIVYYCIACVYFFVELVVLLVSLLR